MTGTVSKSISELRIPGFNQKELAELSQESLDELALLAIDLDDDMLDEVYASARTPEEYAFEQRILRRICEQLHITSVS